MIIYRTYKHWICQFMVGATICGWRVKHIRSLDKTRSSLLYKLERFKKKCAFILLTSSLCMSNTAYAANWNQNEQGIWYTKDHTFGITDDGYFVPNGSLDTLYEDNALAENTLSWLHQVLKGEQATCRIKVEEFDYFYYLIKSVLGINLDYYSIQCRYLDSDTMDIWTTERSSVIQSQLAKNLQFCQSIIPTESVSVIDTVEHIENELKQHFTYDNSFNHDTLYEGVETGLTVCAGIAAAEYISLKLLGIPVKYVIADSLRSENENSLHALIFVYDGSNWLLRDPSASVKYYKYDDHYVNLTHEYYKENYNQLHVF